MPPTCTAARQPKSVATIRHKEASRPNIPTAEYQPAMTDEEQRAVPVTYPRNTDLDPQLVWRGKDEQDQSDLVAHAPPLYIQEKVHPKVLIADLMATSRATAQQPQYTQPDLFADFNGLPAGADRTDFYQHEGNWSNRMILGDSLQVMASLAEREGLRGKVQCIYLDPPYGIKFNSNFQWSTTRTATCATATPPTSPVSRSRSRPSAIPGATASTPTSPISATASPSPATCSPKPAPSSCRSATRTCIASGH